MSISAFTAGDAAGRFPLFSLLFNGFIKYRGGVMSKHKKVERMKELDRKRRRREKSLKLRAKEEKAAAKHK
jgi:hypothetical protein